MAFNIQSWGRVSGAANNQIVTLQSGTFVGAPNIFTYCSATDILATIGAVNYFARVAGELNVGDLIYCVGTDGYQSFNVQTVVVFPPSVTLHVGSADGDVVGPASSTNTAIATFNGTTGKIIQSSPVLISAGGNVTGVVTLTATTLNSTALTASRAVVTDASKNLASSATTATELGYVNGVTSAIQTQFTNKISITSAQIYAAATGTVNSFVVTLSPAPSAYTAGMVVNFKSNHDILDGGCTINVNGLGSQAIRKDYNTPLVANDILNGQLVTVMYDGADFQMMSPTSNLPGGIIPVTEGGTGVATLTTAYGVLTAGTTATGNVQTIVPGAAGTLLKSGGASAVPTYTTSTYPDTNGANTLLYASSANVMSALPTANTSVLITNGSGVPSLGTPTVPHGGTGVTTLTNAYGVLTAGTTATGNIQTVTPGAAGLPLVSGGVSALPTYTALTVPGGGTGVATFITAYGVITAGTTATGPLQTVTPGTAGALLQSGGASAVPTYTTSIYPATNAVNTLLYAASANVMAALTTANSSVLVTSGSGAPSLSTTLPSGIAATSMTLTTPVLGTPTSGTLTNCTGYGALRSVQTFTSGSGTYTRPAGILNILVECVGGGGGGGGAQNTAVNEMSAAGGGGGGGYARLFIASAASTYSYAVGGAGSGAGAGSGGGVAGGNSTFSTLTANGGAGGGGGTASTTVGAATAGGTGGTASGGNFNCTGASGTAGLRLSINCALGGYGASSYFGGASPMNANNGGSGVAGLAGTAPGAGGGGGSSVNPGGGASAAGGNGVAGLIYVWEFA